MRLSIIIVNWKIFCWPAGDSLAHVHLSVCSVNLPCGLLRVALLLFALVSKLTLLKNLGGFLRSFKIFKDMLNILQCTRWWGWGSCKDPCKGLGNDPSRSLRVWGLVTHGVQMYFYFLIFSSRYGCPRTQNAVHARQNSHPLRTPDKHPCSASRTAATPTTTPSYAPAGRDAGSCLYKSNCSSQEPTQLSKETQWYTGVKKDSPWYEQHCKVKWAFSTIWFHHKYSGTLYSFMSGTVGLLKCDKSVVTKKNYW